ncbi:MAG: cation:proton antiporter [Burkholderiales bacterium]
MDAHILIIGLCLVLIASFFYNYLLKKFQISPVLLLILTGIGLKLASAHFGVNFNISSNFLAVCGTLGLIAIVLEASFDLKVNASNRRMVVSTFLIATLIMLLSMLAVAAIFWVTYQVSWLRAILYALPFAIVSSAIVLPSITKLTEKKREFLAFDSIFSDIVGVLIFNFVVASEFKSVASLLNGFSSLMLMLLLSIAVSIPLALLINRNHSPNRHVFILAVLILVYALAKVWHLSALILILIFGLTLNNIHLLFSRTRFKSWFNLPLLEQELAKLCELTSIFAFVIRTVFFVVLGYSLNLSLLLNWSVILLGLAIVGLIYGVRLLILKIFLQYDLLTATLTAPRGLITVLLFYQIPNKFAIDKFNSGVVFFVVVVTSLVMSFELVRQARHVN